MSTTATTNPVCDRCGRTFGAFETAYTHPAGNPFTAAGRVELLCDRCNAKVWEREAEIEQQAEAWHNGSASEPEPPRGFV
jgi:hypothetical protein